MTPTRADPPNCITVTSSPGGTMSWAGNVVGGSKFTGSFNLAAGRTALNLNWEKHTVQNGNCKNTVAASGSFTKVAAPYMSNLASGPVQYLKLSAEVRHERAARSGRELGRGEHWPEPVLQVRHHGRAPAADPGPAGDHAAARAQARESRPVARTRPIDCDKNINYADEITNGCKTTYRVNYDDLDGDGDLEWRNINCNGYFTGNLPPSSFVNNPAPDCAMTETGDKTGPMRQGLAARFESPCKPNYWPAPTATQTDIDLFFTKHDFGNDPRYVTLIITDNTAFTGSGNEPVPVKYFAGFYVTGWDIGGATNGCPDPDGPGTSPRQRVPPDPRLQLLAVQGQRRRLGTLREHRRVLVDRRRSRSALQLRRGSERLPPRARRVTGTHLITL